MLRAFRFLGIGVLSLAGCSLFTAIEGFSEGDDFTPPNSDAAPEAVAPGNDASVTDAAASSDADAATDADAAPPPNLQPNGGFEIVNGSGCGVEWGGFQATRTRVTTPRTGTYACKSCGNHPSDGSYSLSSLNSATNIQVKPGERYRVEAWVRALDGAVGTQNVRGVIRIYAPGDSTNVVQRIDPPAVPLTTTWLRLETILAITDAGDFNYYVSSVDGPISSCSLADDIVVQRLQ
jgi:hypothetical protein